ncbi:MAG: 3-phosphoshikimate 1-carboxyvinyltransferase [Myxococcota bacterium]
MMVDGPVPVASAKAGGLSGTIRVPGDKSISHRALMLATLAVGRSEITGLLTGEDVLATAAAMRAMGATIETGRDGVVSVDGVGLGALAEPDAPLDFGNAGTGSRLAMGVVAAHTIAATVVGDASLSGLPMGRVLNPLRDMGVSVVAREGDRLPLTLRGPKTLAPIRYKTPVASAQVKSAILLAGLGAPGETTVVEAIPTRDHTERMLRAFGAEVRVNTTDEGLAITVVGQPTLNPCQVTVPGDPSSAAFPIVAALIVPGSNVLVENVLLNPSRTGLIKTLTEMGGDIEIQNERSAGGELVGDVRVRASALKGVAVPADRAASMIDEYPVLAAAAAFAEGTTLMQGVHELRVKESDRLAAMAEVLGAYGVPCTELEDGLVIEGGGALRPATIDSRGDHRIAMAAACLALAVPADAGESVITNAAAIATSFPTFTELLGALGADLSYEEA